VEQPRVSTEFGKRSFSYLAPKTWNNLPLEIRLSSTYHNFKCGSKGFCSFSVAFYFTAPSSPPSDWWRLRFSLRVDIVRLINSHIIIIIILILQLTHLPQPPTSWHSNDTTGSPVHTAVHRDRLMSSCLDRHCSLTEVSVEVGMHENHCQCLDIPIALLVFVMCCGFGITHFLILCQCIVFCIVTRSVVVCLSQLHLATCREMNTRWHALWSHLWMRSLSCVKICEILI